MSNLYYLAKPVAKADIANTSSVRSNKLMCAIKRWRVALLMAVFIALVSLTGCGQSGDLYLAKDAPSNTDFILYKGNKSEDAKAALEYDQKQIEAAAAEDPADY
ncbi:LPS translocon maturation chaperone LptM [Psychrobacter lutiphocae]|uniref:LPS translocon maturation chaperone LptM n=1 Tax=Psychrobacter lutiphocae TaxID=540500 RepID=UPI00037C42C6|nr:lipoprotein [Psychrobacter lutiphocae]